MKINKDDILLMKIVHFFITKENFVPVIIRGLENEIWLENKHSEYRIIRIVTKNIFNEEQLNFDIGKTKNIVSQIKRQTLNPFMDMLSIYVNLDDDIKEKLTDEKHYTNISIKDEKDLLKNEVISKYYKGIDEDFNYEEEGFPLIAKITSDITKKNIEENERFNNMYNQKKPIVTWILIGINVLIFLLMYIIGKGSEDLVTLTNFGAIVPSLVKAGDYYRLLSSAFLHIGFIHLLCNMYSLYAVGPTIEHFYGKGKFVLIYLYSAIIASLFVLVFQGENTISAGASGAIFGLLGSLLYFGFNYRGYLGNQIINRIIPVIIINLFIGFTLPGISIAAHIGGLIGGVFVSYMLGINDKKEISKRITGTIFTIIFTAFMIYLAFFR